MGYNTRMRVQMTEIYRDWINSLKDLAGRARVDVDVHPSVRSARGALLARH